MYTSSRHERNRRAAVLLCRTLCLCATWAQATAALPREAAEDDVSITDPSLETFALIPSAPKSIALIPSEPPRSQTISLGLIPSQPAHTFLIPSEPAPSLVPSQLPPQVFPPSQRPSSGLMSSQPPLTVLIPSQPIPPVSPSGQAPTGLTPSGSFSTGIVIIPSATVGPVGSPRPTDPPVSGSNGIVPPLVSMASTEEGLKPIPAPTTVQGDPDGHHEITEPNLTATNPCRGCSPIIEISVSGFWDGQTTPDAEHAGTSADTQPRPTQATVTAGQSQVVISQDSTGSGFLVGDSSTTTTITPGQTITIDNTPLVVQTTGGKTQIVIASTQTIPLQPAGPQTSSTQITDAPLVPILAPLTIGTQTISANSDQQYVVSGTTLEPGGPAITVDGTTVSLMPSATAVVVNGQTSTLSQALGQILTTTAAPLLTLNSQVYTANRAGYYILAPGTTLIAGGPPVTVSGSVISLEPHGTAAIIQGSTSVMQPLTTIVTLTRPGGLGGGPVWSSSTDGAHPAAYTTTRASSAGTSGRVAATIAADGLLGSILLLSTLGFGWLAVWL